MKISLKQPYLHIHRPCFCRENKFFFFFGLLYLFERSSKTLKGGASFGAYLITLFFKAFCCRFFFVWPSSGTICENLKIKLGRWVDKWLIYLQINLWINKTMDKGGFNRLSSWKYIKKCSSTLERNLFPKNSLEAMWLWLLYCTTCHVYVIAFLKKDVGEHI